MNIEPEKYNNIKKSNNYTLTSNKFLNCCSIKNVEEIFLVLCVNNAIMSIICQSLVNTNSKFIIFIWPKLCCINYIISLYKEYYIHYDNVSFRGILNLIGISIAFTVSYCIYRTEFLYWIPILYMKHFINLIIVKNKLFFLLMKF